jgi:hypothetical protein
MCIEVLARFMRWVYRVSVRVVAGTLHRVVAL